MTRKLHQHTHSDLKFSTVTPCLICQVTSIKEYNDGSATYTSKIKTNTSTYHDLLFVRFLFRYD
jgi:hypothetical protein